MCGITSAIIKKESNKYWDLLKISEIRGQDGTGITILRDNKLKTYHWPQKASFVSDYPELSENDIIIGQNRLACFGLDSKNNQPLVTERYALVHNGNLINFEKEFKEQNLKREYEVDTELILRIIERDNSVENVFKLKGNFACLLIDKEKKTLTVFRRDKPIWYTEDETGIYFYSTDRIGKKIFDNGNELKEKEIIKVVINKK